MLSIRAAVTPVLPFMQLSKSSRALVVLSQAWTPLIFTPPQSPVPVPVPVPVVVVVVGPTVYVVSQEKVHQLLTFVYPRAERVALMMSQAVRARIIAVRA